MRRKRVECRGEVMYEGGRKIVRNDVLGRGGKGEKM